MAIKLDNETAFGIYRFSWTAGNGSRCEVFWYDGATAPSFSYCVATTQTMSPPLLIRTPERFGWRTPRTCSQFEAFVARCAAACEDELADDEPAPQAESAHRRSSDVSLRPAGPGPGNVSVGTHVRVQTRPGATISVGAQATSGRRRRCDIGRQLTRGIADRARQRAPRSSSRTTPPTPTSWPGITAAST